MGTKAAVVIGADRTGGLEPLQTAAAGANDVADWLKAEGYFVKLLTDAGEPLHASAVAAALSELVTNPVQYELLVVYFSGHGYLIPRSDLWLFSDAPTNTADAINLGGAMDLARYSGIETVVFISDACRNIPDSAAAMEVVGIDAFPNLGFDTPSKVDYVKATGKARAAFEAAIPATAGGTGNRESILTKAWRAAYEKPTADMVRDVDIAGTMTAVVPNRRLEDYLQPKVDEFLAAVDITLTQNLEISIPSRDDVFIARAKRVDHVTAPFPTRFDPLPGVIRGVTAIRGPVGSAAEGVEHLLPRHDLVDHYESECGFVIVGAGALEAACTKGDDGAWVEILDHGDPSLVRVWNVSGGVSIVIKFDDGRNAVLPALRGYIGHVTVDEVGISNVSYVPSSNTERYTDYQYQHEEVDRLRAMVAMAVDRNRFEVRDDGDSWKLADGIRIGKALDPSLGIYAALAYSQAGIDQAVVDVLSYMRTDLGRSIFDVVLLASRHIDLAEWPWVPFCPVLTQNWNLLRPRGFEVAEPLNAARPHLRDSLWTTFGPEVGDNLLTAVTDGTIS